MFFTSPRLRKGGKGTSDLLRLFNPDRVTDGKAAIGDDLGVDAAIGVPSLTKL
jgi:hypothetical protein